MENEPVAQAPPKEGEFGHGELGQSAISALQHFGVSGDRSKYTQQLQDYTEGFYPGVHDLAESVNEGFKSSLIPAKGKALGIVSELYQHEGLREMGSTERYMALKKSFDASHIKLNAKSVMAISESVGKLPRKSGGK